MKIGTEGHVSFLLLDPKIVGHEEVISTRDAVTGEPLATFMRAIVDGTTDSGESACSFARVAAVNDDGTVNAAGLNDRGDPRSWRAVRLGSTPEPLTDEGREDPAGHVFHEAGACPFGR